MQRSILNSLSLVAAAGLATVIFAGCAPAPNVQSSTPGASSQTDDTPATEETEAGSSDAAGTAVLSYGDTTYTAELQYCSLSANEDALFHGVAYDDAGTAVGYLEGDFSTPDGTPYGEARIDFGATRKLQSMDEFVAMGSVAGAITVADFSNSELSVTAGTWNQDGTQLPTSTLKVRC